MQPMRRISVMVALGIAIACLSPSNGLASDNLAAINGAVRDKVGLPVINALVVVVAANSAVPEHMAFTDGRGLFSVPNLLAGEYSVKVTMPSFLPALKNGIQIHAGSTAVLTVNLQSAFDVVRRVMSRDKGQAEDIVWTLRSSRSTQPILQFAATTHPDLSSVVPAPFDYSGYLQLYSKSVETSSGVEDGVGSQFSLTMPLDPKSQVTLSGQYSESPAQPRGFAASYQFSRSDRHRTTIGLNMRQGALIGDPVYPDGMKEIQLNYGEDFQWTDHLVVDYGAELGRADVLTDRNYVRPRLSMTWVPEARTTINLKATSQAPSSPNDEVRGIDYFDRTAYIPPSQEGYGHAEFGASHVISDDMDVSAAVFRDRFDTQTLFVSSPEGVRGVLILDSSRNPSEGLRIQLNREFRGFEAGLGYTTTTGLTLSDGHIGVAAPDIQNDLKPMRFHLVTARFKADLDSTQTQFTAVYRWVSNFAVTRLDPYQQSVEYNDPSLSLTVAQNLPTFRMLPAKVQAILDARNLFERMGGPGQTQLTQYPRLLKGGINIKF